MKYKLLSPEGEEGGTTTVTPPAAPAKETPIRTSPLAPAKERKATPEELKQTFSSADMGDLNITSPSPESTSSKPPAKVLEGAAGSEGSEATRTAATEPKVKGAEAGGVTEQREVTPAEATVDKGGLIMPPGKGTTRDYTGFSPEEQAILKQMSNPAFDYAVKLAKENKELAKQKGGQFLQHPQAYTLDPEYQRLQEDSYYLNQEFTHWQQQLNKIKLGEPWRPLIKWDAKGQPVYGPEQEPTSQDEEQIRLAMNGLMTTNQQLQANAQQFIGTYQQRVQTDNQLIMQEQSKRFGWVADPKLLDEKLNISGTEKSIKQIKQEFVDLFPSYHHNSVAVDVAANLFVASIIQGIRLQAAEAGKQVAEIKQGEVLRAEPTSAATRRPEGKAYGGVTEFSLEGLPH